jgi:hypothetical protein
MPKRFTRGCSAAARLQRVPSSGQSPSLADQDPVQRDRQLQLGDVAIDRVIGRGLVVIEARGGEGVRHEHTVRREQTLHLLEELAA